ncbi:hypothetical protein [Sinorhizobium sp. Sb3]|uniref:hypothetical protein n=1 Tax=Sinorhizobium/Ensifer group TaxID=227292 RepID=UPI000AADD35A|nr:hypothetical protein [Sinorhizobium sp. Sb3]
MESSDRKEISHCDIARQKAVPPVFQAFVRKATVFPAQLTLSDKNCQRYATITKRAPGLCLPIATFSAAAAGVGKRQVTFVLPHGGRLPGPNAFAARVQGGLDAHAWLAVKAIFA